MLPVKRFSHVALMLAAASLLMSGCGDPYPSKTINGVIAWGAGGGTDSVSRVLTPMAEKVLEVPIRLANKTGATDSIAAQAVHEAKADGYTLMFHAENPQLY